MSSIKEKLLNERFKINSEYYHTVMNGEADADVIGLDNKHLLLNQDGDASWESKVFVVEKLGSGTFLYLEKDGEPLVVETEGDSNIKVGDTVKVGFTASRCQLFDSSNQAFK